MRALILCRPDRVGDVVIATACLAPIRLRYPEVKIYFVADERMRPLLDGHPLLEGFISLSSNLTAEFQRVGASAIVHLHPNKACYLAAQQAGAPVRIGYPARFLTRHLTHPVPDRRKLGLQHEAANNCELLRPLEIEPPKTFSQTVHLPETALRSLQAKLPWPLASTRFVALNPSAHSKIARWPVERFLEVAARLQKQFDLCPVFVGVDAADSVPTGTIDFLNLAGKTDLAELGWLLRHASLLVSNATGPAHLAAAVGCPVAAIFGRNEPLYGPTRWRPLSEKVVVLSKPLPQKRFESRAAHWRRSFAAITEGEVMATVAKLVSAPAVLPAIRNTTNPLPY